MGVDPEPNELANLETMAFEGPGTRDETRATDPNLAAKASRRAKEQGRNRAVRFTA